MDRGIASLRNCQPETRYEPNIAGAGVKVLDAWTALNALSSCSDRSQDDRTHLTNPTIH